MKVTDNGKRYNTDTCEDLGKYDHHNNGNYSGSTHLLRAKDGTYLEWTSTNGQDCYLRDNLCVVGDGEVAELVDSLRPDEEEEARLAELGLIEIV